MISIFAIVTSWTMVISVGCVFVSVLLTEWLDGVDIDL